MSTASHEPSEGQPGTLARFALAMTAWTERWVPDAFVFALLATVRGRGGAPWSRTPASLGEVADIWGTGFWELIPFTMQMSLVIITGYVLASSPPMGRLIRWLAAVPPTPRGAVALVTLFALVSSWFNWGFSLSVQRGAGPGGGPAHGQRGLPRARRRQRPRAGQHLGPGPQRVGGVADGHPRRPAAAHPRHRGRPGVVPDGIIGLSHTIFLWQSLLSVLVEIVVVVAVMWFATPPPARARTARDLGIDLDDDDGTVA